jgi:hypothetical protein
VGCIRIRGELLKLGVRVSATKIRTLYVLFAIEVASRRVLTSASPETPTPAWVTQQARNLAPGERFGNLRFLIRDRDSKFTGPFDEVFRSEGVKLIETPVRAPRANALVEVGPHGSDRVPGLDADFGRRHLGANPSDLQLPLQRPKAASRSRPGDPGAAA